MESTPSRSPAARAVPWLLALLLVWSCALRLWDGSRRLQSGRYYDERFTFRNISAVLRDHSLQPRHAFYLSLSYLPQCAVLAASEGLARASGVAALSVFGPTADGYSPTAYRICRGLNTLFGLLSLYLLYRVGARLFNRWVGLLAAAVLAAFPRHVLASSEIKPDILVILLVVSTFLWTLRAAFAPSLRRYLLVGVGVGLAVSAKYTGIAAALPITAAVLFDFDGWRNRRRWLRRWLWLLAAGLTSVAVFVALNPYLGMVLEFIPMLVHGYAAKGVEERSDHWVVVARTIDFLIEHHGPVVAAFVGLGALGLLWRVVRPFHPVLRSRSRLPGPPPGVSEPAAQAAREERLGALLVLSILLGYTALHAAGMTLFRGQNYLPAIPFSSLAAAWAMVELWRWLARRLPLLGRRGVAVPLWGTVGVLLLVQPSRVVYARAVPSAWEVATRRLAGDLDPLELRQVANERGLEPLQLQGQEHRALTLDADRLDRLRPEDLDLFDAELFPRRRLEEPAARFYRSRIDRLPAAQIEIVGRRFLRSQREEWVVLRHPWREEGEGTPLDLRPAERPRQIEAPLPPGLGPGAVVSVVGWVPRDAEGSVDTLLVDPGARRIPLYDASRKRNRIYLLSPRFVLTGHETGVRLVAGSRRESLAGFGLVLHRWQRWQGWHPSTPPSAPAPSPSP
jgi:4-amino-4-deoxy-L-arabinose transferase-like glycosyltransferase